MKTAEKIQIGQIATNGNYLLDQMSLYKLIKSLYKILCSVFEKVIGQIMLDAAAEIRGKTIKFYIKEKERDSIDTQIRMYEARSAEYIPVYASTVIEFLLRIKIHKIVTCVSRFYIEKTLFRCVHGKPRNFSNVVSWLSTYIVLDLASITVY